MCLGYVLRTGFDTAKGKLIRTVIFNNENIQIKQTEAFYVIFLLLIFSIISSANVLIEGLFIYHFLLTLILMFILKFIVFYLLILIENCKTGLADPERDRNKLFLRCILIITTVVPPELPMILSIAVNGSLMYL